MTILLAVIQLLQLCIQNANAVTTCDFTWGSFFILNQATTLDPNSCTLYTNSLGQTGHVASPTLTVPVSAITAMQSMCATNTAPLLFYQYFDEVTRCAGVFVDGGVTTDLNCGLFTESILCTWNSVATEFLSESVTVTTESGVVSSTVVLLTSTTSVSIQPSTIRYTVSTTSTSTNLSLSTISSTTTNIISSRTTNYTLTTITNQQTLTSTVVTVLPTTISLQALSTTTTSSPLILSALLTTTSTIITCG